MKAILFFAISGIMELSLPVNGQTFTSNQGESKEDFINRIKDLTLEEFDLVEKFEKDLKKSNTKALQSILNGLPKGLFYLAIENILISRGAIESHPSMRGSLYNGTLGAEELPEHQKSEDLGSIPEPPKSKKQNKPKDSGEQPKEPKPLKKQLSDSEVLPILEEAEKNKGHIVFFVCTKTKEKTQGVIKGVRLDKRNNFIQYRILASDGNMYGKGIDSVDLQIGDLAPVETKDVNPEK